MSSPVDLLVTTETRLHRRRLLLVAEGRRIRQRIDAGRRTETGFGEAERAEQRAGLTGGH